MNITNNKFTSIEQMTDQLLTTHQPAGNTPSAGKVSFEEILKTRRQEESQELRFSKHANERLASRQIDLSKEQLERLENGTNKAREKGIQESLVMVDHLAFIVNVKNNTVVTAVGDNENRIFTNIDGAVIG